MDTLNTDIQIELNAPAIDQIPYAELSELQLVLVGGGIGDTQL